jgi:hypothetical protein
MLNAQFKTLHTVTIIDAGILSRLITPCKNEITYKWKTYGLFRRTLRKYTRDVITRIKNPYFNPFPALRLEREIFQVQKNVFIMNAKESISKNIEKIVYWHYTRGAS